MLTLIFGRAGTGKSEFVMNRLIERAERRLPSVLMIPEQSSFGLEKTMLSIMLGSDNDNSGINMMTEQDEGMERKLFSRLAPGLSDYVTVKSFRKLCYDLFKTYGGISLPQLSKEAHAVLVRRAADSLSGALPAFSRHFESTSFCASFASVLDEFKNSGVTPEMLASLSDRAGSELSKEKFRETALIAAKCDELMREHYTDTSDSLTTASDLAVKYPDPNVSYWFDGFTGFTEPELLMIRSLMLGGCDITVTLCCDDGDAPVFEPIRRTARRLKSIAVDCGADIADEIILRENHRFKSSGLADIEAFFAEVEPKSFDGVSYRVFPGPYEEAEYAAARIARLVRDEGYRYRDFAVIVRDTERYRSALRRSFELFEIPYFSDWNRNLSDTTAGVFMLSALSLTTGLTSEAVLRIVKTGLCRLTDAETDELVNYVFVWDVDGGDWLSSFAGNPDGINEMSDGQQQRLALAESARSKLMSWLAPLLDDDCTGSEAIRRVYEFAEACGAADEMKRLDVTSTAAAFAALDSLYRLADGENPTPLQLYELAELLFDSTSVGSIPQGIDTVQIGGADRMRTDSPRAVFCLGLNEGVFPLNDFDAPLFTMRERDLLCEGGAELTSSFDNKRKMERYFLYRSLTAARERVYLSCARSSIGGEALEPTSELTDYFAKIGTDNQPLDRFFMIVNERTALKAYAENPSEYSDLMPAAESLFSGIEASLRTHSAVGDVSLIEKIVGSSMTVSPTRIETFNNCPFSYFLQYVLGIVPRRKASMSPLEAGTFTHALVEYVMRLTDDITALSDEDINRLCKEAADKYVSERLGSAHITARMEYLIERLIEGGARLIRHIRSEQTVSDFKPSDLEMSIGEGESVEPRTLMLPDGKTVRLIGKIDRVDVLNYNGKEYLRVIDYKTGTREFSLSEVWAGLSVQMLVYLFSVCSSGKHSGAIPAGVLYLPADPSVNSSNSGEKIYCADGIILDDPEIVKAMDKSASGIFIPVSYGKDGFTKNSEKKLASAELLGKIKEYTDSLVIEMARKLYDGKISPNPLLKEGRLRCEYCEYAAVCRRDRVTGQRVYDNNIDKEDFLEFGGDEDAAMD